jgi:hypothetical protein
MKSTKKGVARKKRTISFPPVPTISLRIEEKRLLEHINKSKSFKNRFNINNYSDMYNIPRSTTRSRLKKLNRIGLIYYKPNKELGNVEILKSGEIYLENIEKLGDESSRARGRKTSKKNELSTHWHKFSFPITNREKFRKERLNYIKCSWKENTGMKNWSELILNFDDATIIIKPKTLIIELKDLVSKDVDEVDSKCLRRIVEYTELLKSLGIELGETSIERGHWARVDSLLADVIYKKIGEKYYLMDEDGNKLFWIDFSPDKTGKRKKEDEVPTKIARKNLDYNINQQLNRKFDFDNIDLNSDDIGSIKECLGIITKDMNKTRELDKIRLQHEIEINKLKQLEVKKEINYYPKSEIKEIPRYIN